jgi:DNA-binding transcriptional LysR family regulator
MHWCDRPGLWWSASSSRTISISLSDVGELVFLPKLLERFRAQAPRCTIRSVSMPPAQLAHGLENGEIDLAVGYFPDLTKHDFLQQRLHIHHKSRFIAENVTDRFLKLYLVPGMAHCGGGVGHSTVDWLSPLVDWV